MGLLQKLKSALGLDGTGSSESGRSGDVDVTVEREPSTEDEDAVKGTETASSGEPEPSETARTEPDDAESDDPSPEEFEPLGDESEAETDEIEADMDEAAEADTDEAAEAGTVDETDAAETDEASAVDTDDASDGEETAETAGSTDPVTELNGIGPAYGDRLAGAGIETVGELAGADAADLAEEIDLGESRVTGWIEQANDY